MKITISNFENGERIPSRYALCEPDREKNTNFHKNLNPLVKWADAPIDTKSFALICVDPDAPSSRDDVNVEGKIIPADFPRADFYHWVVADIPANVFEIEEGADSNEVTPKGKPTGKTVYGGISGLNDYTSFFEGDQNMEGKYGNYDGPCPPKNDERIHHYYFRIYALNVETLNLPEIFDGRQLSNALTGRVIDMAEYSGIYTLNPHLIQ